MRAKVASSSMGEPSAAKQLNVAPRTRVRRIPGRSHSNARARSAMLGEALQSIERSAAKQAECLARTSGKDG
jgi:hypothetical protein